MVKSKQTCREVSVYCVPFLTMVLLEPKNWQCCSQQWYLPPGWVWDPRHSPFNKYITRSKNILLEPLCRRNFATFKLSYRGPHLWNKFIAPNNHLANAKTIEIFKKGLKRCIFTYPTLLDNFWIKFLLASSLNIWHVLLKTSCQIDKFDMI